jgi:hypothetical protein
MPDSDFIQAFEDAGARWELPAEDAGRFQFAPASARAPSRAPRAGGSGRAVRREWVALGHTTRYQEGEAILVGEPGNQAF